MFLNKLKITNKKSILNTDYLTIYKIVISKRKSIFLSLFAFFFSIIEVISLGLTALFIKLISDNNYINEIKSNKIIIYYLRNNITLVSTTNFFICFLCIIIIRYFVSLIYYNNIYKIIFNSSTILNSILSKELFNQKFYKLKTENYQSTKNIFFKEIDYYITYFLQPFLLLLPDVFQMFFLLIFLLILLPKTSIIIVIILFFSIYLINKVIKIQIIKISKKLTYHQRNRTLVLGNFYSNILFWRVKNLYKDLDNYFLYENKIISKSSSDLNFFQQVPRLTYEFFIYFIFSIVALLNKNDSSLVFNSFVVMSLATIKLLPSAVKFSSFLQSSLSSKYIITTLNEILNNKDQSDSQDVDYIITDFVDKIELKNAVFTYGDNLILNKCNFILNKNDIISISGNSGVGKSTLIEILLCQHQINSGEYLFDGVDLKNKNVDISKIVGIVPQTIQFINDTLRANILFGTNEILTDDEIIKILYNCNLKNLLDSLPLGLDTIIDNNSNQFSGGERQRIAIARCLLDKKTRILVFDEVTSALDEKNATILLTNIMSYKELYSMIFITHNTYVRSFCNKNYQLKNGVLEIISTKENYL